MDALTAIRRPVEAELQQYKQLFDQALSHEDDFLGQALAHIRQRKGKMMRPLLVLLVAREQGEVREATLRAAVTLEVLHTASLVHDDVVDESDERRGQASVNAVYGNKVAVLVGDYLLSKSLHYSALTGDIRCVDIIARLGATLSEGELQQLANIRRAAVSESSYFDIISRKTAALFSTCGELGAITAGAQDDFVRAAKDFGHYVGMCFQIRDDIFDYYSDSRIGKPTGNDMLEGKLTLPAIYALDNTTDADIHACAARIKAGEASADDIAHMVEFTKQQGGIDYARRVMNDFRDRAAACLTAFKVDPIRQALTTYLDYVIGREE